MRDDDDIIAAAKRGDQEAWRRLYALHASRVLALLQLLPNNDAALGAEDVAAHAWLTAADKIATFRGTAGDFGGWLYTIARNYNTRTSRRSTHAATPRPVGGALDVDWAVGATWADGFDVSEMERLEGIRSLLTLLPERQRAVVACMDVVGLDAATTAQALSMSQAAVRVNRHRGLARLRAHLRTADGVLVEALSA